MSPSSPLKGRTALKRSRMLIRRGADAVALANERRAAVMATEGIQHDDNVTGTGNYCRRESVNFASNSSIIRRRHKRPKLNYNKSAASASTAATTTWNSAEGEKEQELSLPHHYLTNDETSYSKFHHLPASSTQSSIPASSAHRCMQQEDDIGTPKNCSSDDGGVGSSSSRTSTTSCNTRPGKQTFSLSSSRKMSQRRFELSHIGTPQSSSDDGCSNSIPSSTAMGGIGKKIPPTIKSRQFQLPEPGTPSSSGGTTESNSHPKYSQSRRHNIDEQSTPNTSYDSSSTSSIPSTAKNNIIGRKNSSTPTSHTTFRQSNMPEYGTPNSGNDDSCSSSIPSITAKPIGRKCPSSPTYSRKSRLGSIPEHGTPIRSNDDSSSTSILSTAQQTTRGSQVLSSPSYSSDSRLGNIPEHGTPKSGNDDSCPDSIPSTTQQTSGRQVPTSPSTSHKSRLRSIPDHGATKSSNDDSCSSSIPSTARTRERKGPPSPSTTSRTSQRDKIGRRKESTPDTRGSVAALSQESSISTTPQAVTLGGHRRFRDDTTTQDMGNYRMLIDDLSYLSSAIIQCRRKMRTTKSPRRLRNGCDMPTELASHTQHTAVTAGAACGIAELVSHSDTRVKLLTLTARSARGSAKVGAIEAILESVACAPDAPNWSFVCRSMIDQHVSCQPGGKQWNGSSRSCEDEVGQHTALHLRSTVPRSREYDILSSKALSIVAYFVGIDCTESAILSDGPLNRFAIQLTRETVLRHKSALRGIARLVADDPVVNAYLREASQSVSTNERCGDKVPDKKLESLKRTRVRSRSKDFLASIHQQGFNQSSQCDPTKLGRRNRKKRISQVSDSPSSNDSSDFQSKSYPNVGTGALCRGRLADVEFSFNDGEASSMEDHESDLNCANKFDEKILLAMSRIKLTRDNDFGLSFYRRDLPYDCVYCSVWAPLLISHLDLDNKDCFTSTSGLALVAADFIITGSDRWSARLNTDLQDDVDDGLLWLDYSNEQHTSHLLMSENPIVFANEMLRLSGSLPQYSQSMSETLLAILLSLNNHGTTCCSECISYLQKRAFAISEIIDSLCCLSPNVSSTLSNRESYLVPSLLRVILEMSLSIDDDWPFLYVDTASAALKTLTSITHENSVASGQILESLPWESSYSTSSQDNNSSNCSTGVGIVFRYLFKIVSLTQTRSVHQKSMYDHTIFCLNILTNTVEMEPNEAKKVIDAIVVEVDGGTQQVSGLSWLAGWIVSTTSGFRESIMKGSFGSSTITADDSELETGEDDNLVTSGNGFVLLAYLMIGDDLCSCNIRAVVLKELPVDHHAGGIQFIVKVLKAFCNYYHYTVGDISVAVIAPVVKLISGLELLGLLGQDQDAG